MENNNLENKKQNRKTLKNIVYIFLYFILLDEILIRVLPNFIDISNIILINTVYNESKLFIMSIFGIVFYWQELKIGMKNFANKWWKKIIQFIVVYILFIALSVLIGLLIEIPTSSNQYSLEEMINSYPIMIFGTIILAPFVEEIIFRHILIGELSKTIPKFLAIIISCILFALIHSELTLSFIVYFLMGMAFTIIYILNKDNFIASFFYHAIHNSIALLAVLGIL
ncbi:CPBP family intramembrane glutamic endopeptidase [Miniphocaeibacter halophilus]|uniref:CPBP family intramembrane metalloprotease n=1 Tax=Miniphocaeibacter halophilus TaxID=2931922 RepID=A0AC61MSZ7_9FIRM|nr:type II CAAX endopeptidase family protein [Miniphocaeibacter halophilus]QQK08800.1 CPBP family intramembrane metalloprotease [Miniphocaeibacter halophilus]